jgi:hypothetical protein
MRGRRQDLSTAQKILLPITSAQISRANPNTLLTTLGTEAISVLGDAREEGTAKKPVEAAVQTFGRIDILINNTGVGNYKKLVDTSAEEYDDSAVTRRRKVWQSIGIWPWQMFQMSTNRRCGRFRSADAYWVLSQLPLCSPITGFWTRAFPSRYARSPERVTFGKNPPA